MNIKTILAAVALTLLFVASKLSAQTVYITETGKKYHAKNCDIVKTGKKGIDLAEAKKKGLEPCKACKVESETKVADKPKEKQTITDTKKK